MKKFGKLFAEQILLIICLSVIGTGLLIAVFHLPTERMRYNVWRSSDQIHNYNLYATWADGYAGTRIDGWSEYDMLSMAIIDPSDVGISATKQAMQLSDLREFDTDGNEVRLDEVLTDYAGHQDRPYTFGNYFRYWQGSLVLLKPLLLLFEYTDLIVLNAGISILLLCILSALLFEKGLKHYFPAFVITIVIVNPVTMALSWKFGIEYIPMLLFSIYIVQNYPSFPRDLNHFAIAFTVFGAITNYLCMLSFPVITLAVPMLLYFWCSARDSEQQNRTKRLLIGSFSWYLGYFLHWCMKWVLGSMITGTNMFENARNQAAMYEDAGGSPLSSLIARLVKNALVLANWPFLILFCLVLLYVFLQIRKARRSEQTRRMSGFLQDTLLPCLLLALVSISFNIVLGDGYSSVHYWMAYRNLAGCFGAFFTVLADCIPISSAAKSI